MLFFGKLNTTLGFQTACLILSSCSKEQKVLRKTLSFENGSVLTAAQDDVRYMCNASVTLQGDYLKYILYFKGYCNIVH